MVLVTYWPFCGVRCKVLGATASDNILSKVSARNTVIFGGVGGTGSTIFPLDAAHCSTFLLFFLALVLHEY